MKLVALVLLLPTLAFADRVLVAEDATWDCADDPVVTVNAGGSTFTFTGACTSIRVEGGDNQLTIAGVKRLSITGASNKASVDAVQSIAIVGTDNAVTWKGKKPTVKTVGVGNRVTRSTAKPTADKPAADKPADKPAADKPKSAAWDCAKKPTFHTGDGAGSYRFVGTCKKISVGGGENALEIESVDLLEVGGGENRISVGTVGTIDVTGAGNQIRWKKAMHGDKPVLKGQPDMNTIVQVR